MCRFCELIRNKDAVIVSETKHSIAFMDKFPLNDGHLLVIPKVHIADFYDLPMEEYTEIFSEVKRISEVVKKVYNPKKVGLFILGFEFDHVHIHIIPLYEHYYLDPSGERTMIEASQDSLLQNQKKIKEFLVKS